ncbi:dihydroorotate dehydrogenase electron transfer subunit [Pseudalkalibacillus caeni]|uniref:Dihydroorotate dehydrogenase B (NAD(+)), electron transfer subunit n=1 Tax=Exobacillus caeni TaxID=2574798 RepID=A0A5R9F1E8_9BACL|nr:dihydroorotate dehydrogenase electron transfer subunit [Pseudalkalibacillus caeni]TLS35268.1 dihydroorotate dehydrogenase electron transfer subunit [Pseudalkalibacillus caeni]
MRKLDGVVTKHEQIAEKIFELTIQNENIDASFKPGQFLHLKVGAGMDPLLRRPISICDIDEKTNELKMIYRVEGRGTEVLSKTVYGEKLNVLAPLGNGFPLDEAEQGQTALLVGGGIGVPPLYYVSKELKKRGVNVVHVNGFQTGNSVFYEREFSELGPTFIATVDGTTGTKGFVTDVIEQENLDFDMVFTCGPIPMLKAIEQRYHGKKKVFLSLEQRMGCGIGACFACVCHVQEDPAGASYVKVCSDGPVFPSGEVVL